MPQDPLDPSLQFEGPVPKPGRRGIVRAEMPLFGTAGVIGVGAAAQQQQADPDNVAAALGQGAQ